MHFRTVEPGDVIALAALGKRMSTLPGHPWLAVECNEAVMSAWVNQCIDNGLMVVAEHPTIAGTLVGCVAAAKVGRQTQRHVWSELTLLIDPEFQGDALARSLLLLLLDEVVRHRPEVGKVEGWLPESAAEMITLLQELDFMIEGRAEMRRRNADKSYEADIALGWQNPAFEFEQD